MSSEQSPWTPYVRRSLVRVLVAVAASFAVFLLAPFRGDYWWVGAAVGGLTVAAIVPLTIRRLRAVLVSEQPVIDAVEATVLLFWLLLIGFAAVYYGIDAQQSEFAGLTTRLDSLYFTIVTLSTVGYGDITPSGQLARAIVSLQIVFDLLLIGVAVRAFTTAARHRLDQQGRD